MHWPTLVSVIKILAMGGNAIDEGRTFSAQLAGSAYHRARAVTVHGVHGRLDIGLCACCDADTGNVQQHSVSH